MKKLGLILLSSTTIYSAPFNEKIELFDTTIEKNLNLEISEFKQKKTSQLFTDESFVFPDQVSQLSLKRNLDLIENPLDKSLNLGSPGLESLNLQLPITNDKFAIPDPVVKLPKKNAGLAALMSFVAPGLGHVYLGDLGTAGTLFGTSASTGILGSLHETSPEFKISNLITSSNTVAYGIYAAYRDARNMNGQSNYSYKMPTDSFKDLVTAPFRPSVLMKKEVWGGFLGAFALAAGVGYFSSPKDAAAHLSLSSHKALFPLAALPIGIGEESLFRGYLQSQLCEYMSPTAGIAISSLAFGAVHIPNALFLPEEDRMRYYTMSLPLITTLGAYMGWMTHKNHSLKESVALHAWYDFVLFAASTAVSKAAIDTPTVFNFSTSF